MSPQPEPSITQPQQPWMTGTMPPAPLWTPDYVPGLTDEDFDNLRRPFAVEAIKFRPGGSGVLAYIDARVVIERLNHVVGGAWSTDFEILPTGKQIVCKLTVKGTRREDVGTMGTGSAVDPVKTGYSDALKRAAVHFGVGVSVYALKRISQSDLPANALNNKQITPAGETWLRRGYRKWLESDAGKHFGEPLSHGDVEGSVGDVEAQPTGPPAESVDTPHEYTELLDEITTLYGELAPEQRKNLGPAKFKANLKAAGESEDGLRKLKAQLEERKSK